GRVVRTNGVWAFAGHPHFVRPCRRYAANSAGELWRTTKKSENSHESRLMWHATCGVPGACRWRRPGCLAPFPGLAAAIHLHGLAKALLQVLGVRWIQQHQLLEFAACLLPGAIF